LRAVGLSGKIISKWIIKKYSVRLWTGLNWVRIGFSGRFCEYGNEPLGSIKGRGFLDQPNDSASREGFYSMKVINILHLCLTWENTILEFCFRTVSVVLTNKKFFTQN
jgi:hypothetical protein